MFSRNALYKSTFYLLLLTYGAVCVPGEERYQPVVHNCWQAQFRHLGQQTGVADSVERLRKIQRNYDDEWIGLQQASGSL